MRTRSIATWMSALALGAAAAGCGSAAPPAVSSVGPQTVDRLPPGTLAGPYVPSGALLTVRADQPLDTYYTAPGSTFTATVLTPLRDPSGRVLVAAGAKVHGTFVSFGSADEPRVRLAFQSVDTVEGTVPLAAAVRQAQHVEWIGPPEVTPREAYQFPYDFLEYGNETAGPSDPSQPTLGYQIEQPRQVHVPYGALLGLQLTEPLALPGASVAHPR
jgi:hypothetical protein